MTTRRDIVDRLARACESIYGRPEALRIARTIVGERCGISYSALLADPAEPLEMDGAEELAEQLRSGRPLQYILGRAEFCGMEFSVREGCLIPRPETEELILNIRIGGQRPASILDAGTGSGCIAIALKRLFPEAAVTAVDLSEDALGIARENARQLGAEIELRQADAFDLDREFAGRTFDLIVSNPPYIPRCEEAEMRINVTRFEPREALFVPDDDPLCFYRAIGRAALKLLAPGGSLWFELHETWAEACRDLLVGMGFDRTELFRDLNDKPRMLWSRR